MSTDGYARIYGLNMYYETADDGLPLILIHGGLGTVDMFKPIWLAFAIARQEKVGKIQGKPRKESRMSNDIIAKAFITIDAPSEKVWNALVNPEAIKQYMFGTNVISDWREGSPILLRGEWQDKPYEDKGIILRIKTGHMLQYSHFSPPSEFPDKPENYHTVTIELSPQGRRTRVTLAQDDNASEQERDHSEQNWKMMLENMKKMLEV